MDTIALDVHIEMDGGTMDGYLARPDTGEKPHPAMVLSHDIYGVSDHARDVANRFAAQGYVTLVPDLFWNVTVPEFTDRESFMRFRQSLDDDAMVAALNAAITHVRERPETEVVHTGILGFCMGGYYALMTTLKNPSLAACVDFYGAPLSRQLDQIAELRVPFLGLFGEEDQSIPLDQVRELESRLQHTKVPFEVKAYPGAGHAFFADGQPTYRKDAAEDAWARTLDFLTTHLKGEPRRLA